MANINILDKSIFNRIAAGEVVERPASVVKELVENSIDAGATNIVVEILDGGIRRIKIADNGSGMSSDNLPKAFMPHATSKVSALEDLDKIGTLGFRGEALSSIASVARVTAITKPKSEEIGTRIDIEGGEVLSITPYGSSDGTIITIDDIFYNVPARAKFLKKPKQEESEITNIISRLILANPEISFKYVANDKIVFLSHGTNLKDAIYTVYGKSFVDNMLPVAFEKDIFKFEGFIGKPTFSKPNRTYQTLLINGRYVINQQVSTAIYKAYEGYLMKGNFPFFVLNLNIPLDKLDVNVHPNKLDVKFEESNKIFGIILSGIGSVLMNNSYLKNLDEELYSHDSVINIAHTLKAPTVLNKSEGFSFDNNSEINNDVQEVKILTSDNTNVFKEDKNTDEVYGLNSEYIKKRESLSYFLDTGKKEYEINNDYGFSDSLIKQALKQSETEVSVNNLNVENVSENLKMFDDLSYKIIGIIFNTYIIIEESGNMYLIDQHAAHERILYDKFKLQFENRELATQQLLVPYILDVNYIESEYIYNNLEAFTEIGFDIESFGVNTFKVSSVPLLFKDISIKSFFDVILKDVNGKLTIKSANLMEDYLARSACRTAIKANDIISNNEIEKLLSGLQKDGQSLLCPHGRPVIVKVLKTDIEKWFKRIV